MADLGANAASIAGSAGRVAILEPLLGAERFQVTPYAPGGSAVHGGGGLKAIIKANPLARKAKAAIGGLTATTAAYGPDQYTPMLTHFRELLASGAKESPLVPHALSAETLRIIEAARAS